MSARTKQVKLYGGPLDGRVVTVPAGADEYVVGKHARFWVYTFAGRSAREEMFAKQPNSRRMRRFVRWYVGKFARDPRVEAAMSRETPRRGEG